MQEKAARELQMLESFLSQYFSKYNNPIKWNHFIHTMTIYTTNSPKKQIFRLPFPWIPSQHFSKHSSVAFKVSKLINLFSAKSACTKLGAHSSAARSSRGKKKPKTLHSWILAVSQKYCEFVITSIFLFLQQSKKEPIS